MVRRIIDIWTTSCLRYRKTVLVAVAGITLLAASQLANVHFNNALELWFLEDDPGLVAHQHLIDTFASDELIVVGLEAPDVFTPEVLERVDRLTHEIEKAPHVEKVFSLTNIESIRGVGDSLEVGKLIDMPVDPDTLSAIRARALANELYVGNVVSAAGDFTCIIARLPHYVDDFGYKIEAVKAIQAILDREKGVRLYLAGGPPLDEQFYEISDRDSARMSVLMVGLLAIVLWFLLHSVSGVLLPLATVVMSVVWAMGWIGLSGVRANIITTMLPPLLLAVGVAASMHILVEYRNRCAAGAEKSAALSGSFRDLMTPLFLTSVTTAIGMLSLCISRVEGIREFGVFAALGVAGAFVLSVSFVPVVVSFLPAPGPPRHHRLALSAATLERLHRFTLRRGAPILAVSAVLIAVGIAGATRVKTESAFLEYFPDDAPIKIATRRIEKGLAGTVTLEITIDSGEPDGIKDPKMLAAMADFQTWLEQQPHVSSTQSVTQFFKDMRRAFHGNDQREYKLPQTREEAAQYLLLYELDAPDGDIREYASYDYREARISARMDVASSSAALKLVHDTRRYIAEHFPPGVSATPAGIALLYANMEQYILQSLMLGFSIALFAIFLVLSMQTRSFVLGGIAMIPNVVPIVMCLGIMGFAGIHLDSMTAMVASVSIGLAVDDTIHFITRVRQHSQAGRDVVGALRGATLDVGRAIIYTSITLVLGFGVNLIATFVGIVYFGLLCLLTVVFALLADLFLLPVVLRWHGGAGTMAAPVADTTLAEGPVSSAGTGG
jgi:predicted RND superfamily exporter protein